MKALVAALERIATALEQLVPALQQATREARSRQSITFGTEHGSTTYAFEYPESDE